MAVGQYALEHGLYLLTNVANLDRMPANGAVAMVAPAKVATAPLAGIRVKEIGYIRQKIESMFQRILTYRRYFGSTETR